jgi:hypothetical protein
MDYLLEKFTEIFVRTGKFSGPIHEAPTEGGVVYAGELNMDVNIIVSEDYKKLKEIEVDPGILKPIETIPAS